MVLGVRVPVCRGPGVGFARLKVPSVRVGECRMRK